MSDSFLSRDELAALGLGGFGTNVLISRNARIYNPARLFLGSHVRIDDFCVISAGAGIHIGDYVHIAPFCGLYGGAGIVMKDFTGLSSHVSLYSTSDDFSGRSLVGPTIPEAYRCRLKKGAITLEKFAVIGVGSTLMPGVTLAEGSAVGAHSLVFKSCEPYTIYAGSPAVEVSKRSRTLLELEQALRRAESPLPRA